MSDTLTRDATQMMRHDVFNQVHILVGNLELLRDERGDDRLISDAHNAAVELNRLLRTLFGR